MCEREKILKKEVAHKISEAILSSKANAYIHTHKHHCIFFNEVNLKQFVVIFLNLSRLCQ